MSVCMCVGVVCECESGELYVICMSLTCANVCGVSVCVYTCVCVVYLHVCGYMGSRE